MALKVYEDVISSFQADKITVTYEKTRIHYCRHRRNA